MTAWQLAIDGSEVPVQLATKVGRRLTPAQREIMHRLDTDGTIRPVTAGMIVLLLNETRPGMLERRRQHASSDGAAALKRLAKRGLVERQARGKWTRAGDAAAD